VRIKIREDQMPKFTALFVHFLNVFLFLAGPRVPAEKRSEFRHNIVRSSPLDRNAACSIGYCASKFI
jgi:hypothetical protein